MCYQEELKSRVIFFRLCFLFLKCLGHSGVGGGGHVVHVLTSRTVHNPCLNNGTSTCTCKLVPMHMQAQLLNDKLSQEWQGMSQRIQADVSARLTALHNQINSASSHHQLTGPSSKNDRVKVKKVSTRDAETLWGRVKRAFIHC